MADYDGLSNDMENLSISNSGYVYLVVEENIIDPNGPLNCKVGLSKRPHVCVGKLQTGNPRKLTLLLKYEVNDMRAAKNSAKQALKE